MAALAVVLYHYGNRITEIYPEIGEPFRFIAFGQYGVHLFFVISGFVIYLTVQRATPKSFVIGRFIRLYPTYWTCLLVTVAVVGIAGLPGREVSQTDVLINITMLQGYVGIPAVDGAYWTLAAELGFYIQLAVLFFVGALNEKRLVACLYVWLILTFLASQAYRFVAAPVPRAVLASLSVGCYWIPLFVTGIAFARIWRGDRRVPILVLPICAIAAIGVREIGTGIAAICVIVVFSVTLWAPQIRWTTRPLAFLGMISYPLYLIHQNVGYIAIRGLRAAGVGQVAAVVTAVVGIVLVAAILTKGVDVPLRTLLRRRLLPSYAKDAPAKATPL